MIKGNKIRNLVEPDNQATCLNDIISKTVSLSGRAIDLEYGNKKSHVVELKKGIRELEAIVKSFKKRIADEVTEEVYSYAKARRDNYPEKPNFLKNEE